MAQTAIAKALNLSTNDIREAIEIGFTILNNEDVTRYPAEDTSAMRWLDEGGAERLEEVLEKAELDILTAVAAILAEKADEMFHELPL